MVLIKNIRKKFTDTKKQKSLESLLNYNNRVLKVIDRLSYFLNLGKKGFDRKDNYLRFALSATMKQCVAQFNNMRNRNFVTFDQT